jgi:prepilin-type processing-associated H-X9-DG protein
MSGPSEQGELFEAQGPPSGAINARCTLRTQAGFRVVAVCGVPIAHFAVGDATAQAYAMVTLVEQGHADQVEVARGFACSTRTVRRHQRRFENGGLAALGGAAGYPKGRWRLRGSRTRQVHQLKADGWSNRAIAHKFGVDEKAVRKVLRRLGWKTTTPEQTELPLGEGADPNLSASSTPPTAAQTPASESRAAEPPVASPMPPAPPTSGADPNLSASSAPPSAAPMPASESQAIAPPIASPMPPAPPTPGADPNLSASSTPPSAAPTPPSESRATKPPVAPPMPLAPPTPGTDPNLSASSTDEPLPFTLDTDPADRCFDRVLACLGMLDDAAPLFRPGHRVPRAGVLLAVPALVHTGVFESARDVYGSIGPAFYGLRTTMTALLLLALLRIKRPEALKEHAPDDLGRLLGLDRAPEVKTLRRKLTRLAVTGRATSFGQKLAERRVAAHGATMGFLYVDGHVRAYHGQRTIPKAHLARMRIAMPGTTDYWVNDAAGEPLFVVTAEANAGLVKMLPPVLDEVRRLVGKQRRVTIVFDRGGWSPRLFQKMVAVAGFDILTYRKGRFRRVPRRRFHKRVGRIDGIRVRYLLADQEIRLLRAKLRLRQVTRLSDDGHQTPIVTSRRDLTDLQVAFRMFERWRQENFFKYLREEYALDALVDYKVDDADPEREVPNPRFHALDAELRQARAEVARFAALYGLKAFTNPERARRTMRGFKIANSPRGREVLAALYRCAALEKKRAAVPRRVPVQDVVEGHVVKLATERKHLTNLLKMVAYQAEGDLVRRLAPHYKRADDEGRTLVQTALNSAADIEVTDNELRITLAPLSSPHRSRAIAAVCEELNRSPVCFPGSRLRLRFAVTLPTETSAP